MAETMRFKDIDDVPLNVCLKIVKNRKKHRLIMGILFFVLNIGGYLNAVNKLSYVSKYKEIGDDVAGVFVVASIIGFLGSCILIVAYYTILSAIENNTITEAKALNKLYEHESNKKEY